jgi:hypothetical protein
MPALGPEYLTFHYNCEYRGVPGPEHDPEAVGNAANLRP